MRKVMILILCMMPLIANADYLVFWLNRAATPADKLKVRDAIRTMLRDTSYVDIDSLPVYRSTTNANVTGWLLVADLNQIKNVGADTNLVTKAAFEQWRTGTMANPDHLRVGIAASWEAVVESDRIERVIEP